MIILHVSTERGLRGGERQVLNLLAGLSAAGHANHVACPPDGGLAGELRAAALPGLTLHPFSPRGGADPVAAWRLAALARATGADVVHAHTSHAHALAWLALLAPPWLGGMPARPAVFVSRRVDFAVGRGAVGRAKYLHPRLCYLAISHAVARVLVDGGVPAGRVRVVPSGVDPMRFGGPRPPEISAPRRDETVAARHGAGPGVALLLNVAALVDHKDHATLLRAAARLHDAGQPFRLVIAGEGPLRAELEALRGSLGLADEVAMPGQLDNAVLADLHRAADLFVITSHLEGLGTAVLDALAVGLPVVATAAGGLPESVIPGRTGWLAPPRDAAAVADAIAAALADPEARAQAAAEGPRLVGETYTHASTARLTALAYAEAATLLG